MAGHNVWCRTVFKSQWHMYVFISSMLLEDADYESVFRCCDWDSLEYIMMLDIGDVTRGMGLLNRFIGACRGYVSAENGPIVSLWLPDRTIGEALSHIPAMKVKVSYANVLAEMFHE